MILRYAREGEIDRARQLFAQMQYRDPVSCKAMISGYSQAGRFNEALEPFGKLESLGVHTDEVTMVVVLTASSGPGAWILAKGFINNTQKMWCLVGIFF